MTVVIYLLAGKKYKLKANNKNLNFPSQFCLRSISEGFCTVESKEVSFNGNVYDFSVDYDAIDKSEILDIHQYLVFNS